MIKVIISIALIGLVLVAGCSTEQVIMREADLLKQSDTICGEMVSCIEVGYPPDIKEIPSERCEQFNVLIKEKDESITRCLMGAYRFDEQAAETELEKLRCGLGYGSEHYCTRIGAKFVKVKR